MDKAEILEKSRNENKNKDIAELEIINQAGRIAMIVGVLLCVIISTLDWYFTKTVNWGCWAVDWGILSALFTAKYIKRRRKHELLVALCYLLCFAFFCYGYIFNLLGAAK